METRLNEQIIVESGLNVRVCKGIHLIDFLRLEYYEELPKSLWLFYLDHLVKNTEYIVKDGLPQKFPEFCIALLSDFAVYLKSKHFSQGILISMIRPPSFKLPVHSLVLNQTRMLSYKTLGLISVFLSVKNPLVFIEVYRKLALQELGFKTASDIRRLLLSLSTLPSRTLHLNIEEAHALLKSSPKQISLTPLQKPLTDLHTTTRKASKTMYLSDINESDESLEHSPTQELSEISVASRSGHHRFASALPLSYIEEATRKKSFSEFNETLNSCKIFLTPTDSPRQSSYSIVEIKEILSYTGPETREKQTLITEALDSKKNCVCSVCLII